MIGGTDVAGGGVFGVQGFGKGEIIYDVEAVESVVAEVGDVGGCAVEANLATTHRAKVVVVEGVACDGAA